MKEAEEAEEKAKEQIKKVKAETQKKADDLAKENDIKAK